MRRKLSVAVASVAVALACASTAGAGVGPLVAVSGVSPFAACTVGGPGTVYVNSEVEPWIAVNPLNPSNIIGVYQQDRWADGGAHGLVASVSFNGGATWTQSFAHFTICSGGTPANGGDYERASDPWVTFAPNGTAYQISLSFDENDATNGVLVSRSTDGGLTWSEPKTLIRDTSPFNFDDKESITADPTNANDVYAVWDRARFPGAPRTFNAFHASSFRGDPMFSRTTNGGLSWEPARNMFGTNANRWTIGHQIVVLPNGTLVDIFNLATGSGRQPSPNQDVQAVMRSTDKGVTWSKPITIATDPDVDPVDPDTGYPVRAGTFIPDIAVDPVDGTLYAVWADGRFTGQTTADVVLSRSTDGGLSWSAPAKVAQTPNGISSFTASVDVRPDHTVAVSYYDFRSNTPDPATLPTDYWIVYSHDHGQTWGGEQHLAGPFDMTTAPDAEGYFLGDYAGLANTGSLFTPFFVATNSGNLANRTDAFFRTAGP
jgi:hypothetical protein